MVEMDHTLYSAGKYLDALAVFLERRRTYTFVDRMLMSGVSGSSRYLSALFAAKYSKSLKNIPKIYSDIDTGMLPSIHGATFPLLTNLDRGAIQELDRYITSNKAAMKFQERCTALPAIAALHATRYPDEEGYIKIVGDALINGAHSEVIFQNLCNSNSWDIDFYFHARRHLYLLPYIEQFLEQVIDESSFDRLTSSFLIYLLGAKINISEIIASNSRDIPGFDVYDSNRSSMSTPDLYELIRRTDRIVDSIIKTKSLQARLLERLSLAHTDLYLSNPQKDRADIRHAIIRAEPGQLIVSTDKALYFSPSSFTSKYISCINMPSIASVFGIIESGYRFSDASLDGDYNQSQLFKLVGQFKQLSYFRYLVDYISSNSEDVTDMLGEAFPKFVEDLKLAVDNPDTPYEQYGTSLNLRYRFPAQWYSPNMHQRFLLASHPNEVSEPDVFRTLIKPFERMFVKRKRGFEDEIVNEMIELAADVAE